MTRHVRIAGARSGAARFSRDDGTPRLVAATARSWRRTPVMAGRFQPHRRLAPYRTSATATALRRSDLPHAAARPRARTARADDVGRLGWLDFAEPGDEDDGGGHRGPQPSCDRAVSETWVSAMAPDSRPTRMPLSNTDALAVRRRQPRGHHAGLWARTRTDSILLPTLLEGEDCARRDEHWSRLRRSPQRRTRFALVTVRSAMTREARRCSPSPRRARSRAPT